MKDSYKTCLTNRFHVLKEIRERNFLQLCQPRACLPTCTIHSIPDSEVTLT